MSIQFKNEDLFNFNQLEDFIKNEDQTKKAELVKSKISKYLFISKEVLYILQDNNTYEAVYSKEKGIINKIDNIIMDLLSLSFNNLSELEQRTIKSENKKTYSFIYKTSFPFTSKLIERLQSKDKYIKNNTLEEIHFNNGYINLRTNKFHLRENGSHYITNCIKRDYIPSTKQQQTKIYNILKKIYPDEKSLKAILMIIGAAFSGKSNLDSEILYLIGKGSSAKSFIMNLCDKSFNIYVKKATSESFSVNNSKKDKLLSGYTDNDQIRITWMNELKNEKIDDSFFKQFIDGEISTTKIYKDNVYDVNINHKIFITANELPNIKMDSGVIRRIKSYTHTSQFIVKDNPEGIKEDAKKHIYLKDKNLLDDIVKEGLLNAFVDIITEHSKKYLDGEKIEYTENFNDSKDLLTTADDKNKDFIDGCLIITNIDSDRISKDDMLKLYADFSKKNINSLNKAVLISSLKDKGLRYEAKYRVNNIQGCFIGVKERDETDYIETNESETVDTIDYKQEYEKMKKEMEEMKKQLDYYKQKEYKENEKTLSMDQPNNIKNLLNLEIDTENTNPFDDLEEEPIKKKEVKKIKIKKPKDDDDNAKVVTKEVKLTEKPKKKKAKKEANEFDDINTEDMF